MSIRLWPTNERPREKLLAKGAAALSDAELLALFLRTGTRGKSAVDLARECLKRFNNLTGLFSAPLSEFSTICGLGMAKYAQLQAVLEMSKRALGEELCHGVTLASPRTVQNYLCLHIGTHAHEVFLGLFVDAQNRLIATHELFRGTLTQTSVYPREVIKKSLALNAAGVIFAHNHPSGRALPSQADETITKTLQQALSLVDVQLLDHFIVAGNSIYSFCEQGKL